MKSDSGNKFTEFKFGDLWSQLNTTLDFTILLNSVEAHLGVNFYLVSFLFFFLSFLLFFGINCFKLMACQFFLAVVLLNIAS